MGQFLLLYLALGTSIWLTLSGHDSDLARGYREGRYSGMVVVVVSMMAILFWPRLAFALAFGK